MTRKIGKKRIAIIGPTYPYRGGIAHHTTLLAKHLKSSNEVLLLSFSRQYPGWLFPGKSDKDPSKRPLQTEAEYLIDPINPLTWRKTMKRLQKWQPDVIIMPWWHPYFSLAWASLGRAIKQMPVPPNLVFICHNVLPHEQGALGRRLLPFFLKMALGQADGYIVHSKADAIILLEFFPEASYKVTPLPTYAELGDVANEGEKRSKLPVTLPDDKPLLLFCGLIRPYKGLDVLLDALAGAVQQRALHLLIAGEFWQGGLPLYRAQIDQLNLNENVTIWAEYLPDEQLIACIDRADVVVLPYKSATQSAVIQIAFGRHTPVITTDVGGLGEVVEHGHTGLVVAPNSPLSLANAITFYFDDELGATFQQNIQKNADRFSWDRYQNSLMELCEEIAIV